MSFFIQKPQRKALKTRGMLTLQEIKNIHVSKSKNLFTNPSFGSFPLNIHLGDRAPATASVLSTKLLQHFREVLGAQLELSRRDLRYKSDFRAPNSLWKVEEGVKFAIFCCNGPSIFFNLYEFVRTVPTGV